MRAETTYIWEKEPCKGGKKGKNCRNLERKYSNHAGLYKNIVEIRKIKANLVSIHVDQLVDQGYLSRIDVPGDRRKVELVLNKKANDVIKKGKAFQNHFFSSLFSDIDEKHQKIFKETLELMEKNIDCLLEEK